MTHIIIRLFRLCLARMACTTVRFLLLVRSCSYHSHKQINRSRICFNHTETQVFRRIKISFFWPAPRFNCTCTSLNTPDFVGKRTRVSLMQTKQGWFECTLRYDLIQCQRSLKASKSQFLSDVISNSSHSPRVLFNTINVVINSSTPTLNHALVSICPDFLFFLGTNGIC